MRLTLVYEELSSFHIYTPSILVLQTDLTSQLHHQIISWANINALKTFCESSACFNLYKKEKLRWLNIKDSIEYHDITNINKLNKE